MPHTYNGFMMKMKKTVVEDAKGSRSQRQNGNIQMILCRTPPPHVLCGREFGDER